MTRDSHCKSGQISNRLVADARFCEGKSVRKCAQTCAALLEFDPARAWTLAELGRRTHLSPEHLSREFKRTFGLAPMECLARHRLERAAARALHSDEPLARIGQSVGYDDANYFARRFRQGFGMSPREYRAHFKPSPNHKTQRY